MLYAREWTLTKGNLADNRFVSFHSTFFIDNIGDALCLSTVIGRFLDFG